MPGGGVKKGGEERDFMEKLPLGRELTSASYEGGGCGGTATVLDWGKIIPS